MRPPLARQSSIARSTAQSEHCELSTGTRTSRYIVHPVAGCRQSMLASICTTLPIRAHGRLHAGRDGMALFPRAIRLLEAFLFVWHYTDPNRGSAFELNHVLRHVWRPATLERCAAR